MCERALTVNFLEHIVISLDNLKHELFKSEVLLYLKGNLSLVTLRS